MHSLRYLNAILTLLCVLVALQLWTTWSGWGNAPTTTKVMADEPAPGNGIPDAGAQRKEIVDALKHLSEQCDDLNTFLKSGQLRARMEMPSDANH